MIHLLIWCSSWTWFSCSDSQVDSSLVGMNQRIMTLILVCHKSIVWLQNIKTISCVDHFYVVFHVFRAILESNKHGHSTNVSLFFVTGFISQRTKAQASCHALKLPHIHLGPFVISRAPSNPLPSEPAPVLATVHMFTQSHCTNTLDIPHPHMLSNKSSWLCHHIDSSHQSCVPVFENDTELHESPSSFFTLTAGKCWSRGSLSQGGESVMLVHKNVFTKTQWLPAFPGK